MTSSAPPLLPNAEQVCRRHQMLSRELRQMEEDFARQEREELAAFEANKRKIEAESQIDRDYLISQLPSQISLPPSVDQFLKQKQADMLRMSEEEFNRRKAERLERFESRKRQHNDKWRTLFVPFSVSFPIASLRDPGHSNSLCSLSGPIRCRT